MLLRHACGERVTAEEVVAMPQGEFDAWWPDLEGLREVLAMEAVSAAYVASFGHKLVIRAFLKRAGLATSFKGIITPSDFEGCADGCVMPDHKNTMLRTVIELERERILFFDDTPGNLEAANKEFPGVVHAHFAKPFTKAVFDDATRSD